MEENQPFENIFGNTLELRTIEILLPMQNMYFTAEDLAKLIDCDVIDMVNVLIKFNKYNIVLKKDGKYVLNQYSYVLEQINDINNYLISKITKLDLGWKKNE